MQINEDSKNIECFLDYTGQYPITVYFPLTEDGKEYSFCYYAQTDGTKENRTVITENFSCKASGGFGELLDPSAFNQYKCIASHTDNTVNVKFRPSSENSPQIIQDNNNIESKSLYVEIAKGTNDWDLNTVYVFGCEYPFDNVEELSNRTYEVCLPGNKFSIGDSYFAQMSIVCYFEDKNLFPYWFRIQPVASDNLTW